MDRHTVLVSLALLLLPTAGLAGGARAPLQAAWAADPVWDDGLAEVAIYAARRVIYGAPRTYDAVLITVKEDLDAASLLKADPPLGSRALISVLKHNAVREIPTPNYDYRMMTSVFVERRDPARAVKLTHGSHEWCGNTWNAVRVHGGVAEHDWASYFDGEGDGTERIPLAPTDLFEDQLGVTLRGLDFRAGLELRARLVASLATNRAGPLRRTEATITVAGKDDLAVPAGRRDAWRVEVRAAGASQTWWFDAAGTHPLVRMENDRGERLELRSLERRAYWRLPG